MTLTAEEHIHAVLFVCTANICRSPMAVALFRSVLTENGIDPDSWRIESAGTWAPKGQSAAPEMVDILTARGLKIARHRSRVVTKEMLEYFRLILTMETGHKEALLAEFRSLKGRVYLLSEMAAETGQVEDPTGGPPEAYSKTADEIERLLRLGLPHIIELAGA
jgi:protein-tyrosine-phosphatase